MAYYINEKNNNQKHLQPHIRIPNVVAYYVSK